MDRRHHVAVDVAGRRNALVSVPIEDETEAREAYEHARVTWRAGIDAGQVQVRLVDADTDDWDRRLAGLDGRLS
ncbi:MAG: hypothetical protein IRY92_00550 [Dactylosporangium sp.]|nr:hypothetical protein [Dactylosporangium sp.]